MFIWRYNIGGTVSFPQSHYDELHGAGMMLEPGVSNIESNYIHRFNRANRLCLRQFQGNEGICVDQNYRQHAEWMFEIRKVGETRIEEGRSFNADIRTAVSEVSDRNNHLLSFDTTRTAQKTTPPTIFRCSRNVFT